MKNHDHLIETVFDSPEDLALTGLDEESRRELDLLNNLKSDLKRLRDVPECQLTVQHLREAVLNQRPKPVSRPVLKLWTWVPVAAAATLAFVMVTKPGDFVNSQPQSGEPVAEVPLAAGTDATTSEALTEAVKELGAAVRAKPTPEIVRTLKTPLRRTGRRSAETMTVAAVTKAIEEVAWDAVGEPSGGLVVDSAPAAMTTAVETAPHEETPVVVVGDTRNPETGAAEAQEISKPSDVVFGG